MQIELHSCNRPEQVVEWEVQSWEESGNGYAGVNHILFPYLRLKAQNKASWICTGNLASADLSSDRLVLYAE